MGPVHHTVELVLVDHVLFQGADEDLGGVAEHDDAQGDGEWEDIHREANFGEGPILNVQHTIENDENVDYDVDNAIPQAEGRNSFEILEKSTWK